MKRYRTSGFYSELSKKERMKYWLTEFFMWHRQARIKIPFTKISIAFTMRLMSHYPKLISITLFDMSWRSFGLISIELFGFYVGMWIGLLSNGSEKLRE